MPGPINTSRLTRSLMSCSGAAVRNKYGAKATDKQVNHRSTGRLSTPPDTIDKLDCSGFTRYALYQAARWNIPDGSENQLEWFEKEHFPRITPYAEVNKNNQT